MKTCNSATEARLIKESEKSLDKEFEKMGVKLYIYHISSRSIISILFGGVTIVSTERQRKYLLTKIVYDIDSECIGMDTPATHMLETLAARGFPGASVCDIRDDFNRAHGRRDAKIRLIGYLKRLERLGIDIPGKPTRTIYTGKPGDQGGD